MENSTFLPDSPPLLKQNVNLMAFCIKYFPSLSAEHFSGQASGLVEASYIREMSLKASTEPSDVGLQSLHPSARRLHPSAWASTSIEKHQFCAEGCKHRDKYDDKGLIVAEILPI